jgi:hypothetical protein
MLKPHVAEKSTKKNKNFDTMNSQPIQSFSMPCYPEKTGGLLCHQTLAPNLLARHPADQQVISVKQYSNIHPWDKPAKPPG